MMSDRQALCPSWSPAAPGLPMWRVGMESSSLGGWHSGIAWVIIGLHLAWGRGKSVKRDRFPKALGYCFQRDIAVSRIRRTPHLILRAGQTLFLLLSTAVLQFVGFGADGGSPRRCSVGRFHVESTRIRRPHPAGWFERQILFDVRLCIPQVGLAKSLIPLDL